MSVQSWFFFFYSQTLCVFLKYVKSIIDSRPRRGEASTLERSCRIANRYGNVITAAPQTAPVVSCTLGEHSEMTQAFHLCHKQHIEKEKRRIRWWAMQQSGITSYFPAAGSSGVVSLINNSVRVYHFALHFYYFIKHVFIYQMLMLALCKFCRLCLTPRLAGYRSRHVRIPLGRYGRSVTATLMLITAPFQCEHKAGAGGSHVTILNKLDRGTMWSCHPKKVERHLREVLHRAAEPPYTLTLRVKT